MVGWPCRPYSKRTATTLDAYKALGTPLKFVGDVDAEFQSYDDKNFYMRDWSRKKSSFGADMAQCSAKVQKQTFRLWLPKTVEVTTDIPGHILQGIDLRMNDSRTFWKGSAQGQSGFVKRVDELVASATQDAVVRKQSSGSKSSGSKKGSTRATDHVASTDNISSSVDQPSDGTGADALVVTVVFPAVKFTLNMPGAVSGSMFISDLVAGVQLKASIMLESENPEEIGRRKKGTLVTDVNIPGYLMIPTSNLKGKPLIEVIHILEKFVLSLVSQPPMWQVLKVGVMTKHADIQAGKQIEGGTIRKQIGILKPSVLGTPAMRDAQLFGNVAAELQPVQEWPVLRSVRDLKKVATTYKAHKAPRFSVGTIVFGQQKRRRAFIFLAVGSQEGTVIIYRCYRTKLEVQNLADVPNVGFGDDANEVDTLPEFAGHTDSVEHLRLAGHSDGITSIVFNRGEDQVITTSFDRTVRVWDLDSGKGLFVYPAALPLLAAVVFPEPFDPEVVIITDTNQELRVLHVEQAHVFQEVQVTGTPWALTFDHSHHLFVGASDGSIHACEATDSCKLVLCKSSVQPGRRGVTSITFVPGGEGRPPCVLAGARDNTAIIVDVHYGHHGKLHRLTMRQRVAGVESIRCCASVPGAGYLISGCGETVCVCSIESDSDYSLQYLKHHRAHVSCVAVNLQDTMLASADCTGVIVLWRRTDFSHLPDLT